MSAASTIKMTPRMQQAFDRIGDHWGPYPGDAYVRTLDAMKKRGLIEERFLQDPNTGSTRWQYRRAPGVSK